MAKNIKKPALPTDVGPSNQDELQVLRDEYQDRLLDCAQDYSLQLRQLNRVQHELGRIERKIEDIDALSEQQNITLRKVLTV